MDEKRKTKLKKKRKKHSIKKLNEERKEQEK